MYERGDRINYIFMVIGSVSVKLRIDSAGKTISLFPVYAAPAVPVPAPAAAPIRAPLPPPARPPMRAPAPAPPPIKAAVRLPLPLRLRLTELVFTSRAPPLIVTDSLPSKDWTNT